MIKNYIFLSTHSVSGNDIVKKLWSGNWSIENQDLCKELISTGFDAELLKKVLKQYQEDDIKMVNILQIAINTLLTFCNHNWSPHPEELNLEEFLGTEWPQNINVNEKLQRDSEPLHTNILYPELLYMATEIFSVLYSVESNLVRKVCLFCTSVHVA